MRLHTLTLQAFGPFRTRQTIDFDTLSQGGLFLLHGATGAGKSTIFDAVCYALYGNVPGGETPDGAAQPPRRPSHAHPGRAGVQHGGAPPEDHAHPPAGTGPA
ncbi:AAA family ATPase [Kitasatospora mediocidica]|uniref:AAA family ATPase n=1 Tax=Kitasatospora mediocidica TaxID=58352 RepID=UPI000A06DE7C